MATVQALERTPLYECHVAAGARLIEFAGWEMPVQYTSLLEEHRAVRRAAGLFDVSHMGEIRVSGAGAEAFLDFLTPGSVASLEPLQAQYSALLTEAGTYIDDLLIYRRPDDFMLVVNASNTADDLDWVVAHAPAEVDVRDVSREIALLALQGPSAESILAGVCECDLSRLPSYRFCDSAVCGVPAMVSRTGYTGEDGFEIYFGAADAAGAWRGLLAAGRGDGLLPCGLGARDTLRLEAGLSLYGHEIDRTILPFEARLGWTIRLDGTDFVGRDALLAAKAAGVHRRLVGLELGGRRIARQGAVVLSGGEPIGEVTSGSFSPTLGRPIAMARVAMPAPSPGTALEVEVRGSREHALVTRLPFYERRQAELPPQQ